MTGERVRRGVVGQKQDAEHRQHEDGSPSRDGGQPEHRPEDAYQEFQLLALEDESREPVGVGDRRRDDRLRRGAELAVAVRDAL